MTARVYPTREEAAECAARWLWWWYQTHREDCANEAALARRLHSSRTFVSQLFRSQTRKMGFDKLLAVWALVGVSLGSLVTTPAPPLPRGAELFPEQGRSPKRAHS